MSLITDLYVLASFVKASFYGRKRRKKNRYSFDFKVENKCFNSPKKKYHTTCDLRVLLLPLRTFLASRLDSLTYSSKSGTGGNLAESSNSKINLAATSCLP